MTYEEKLAALDALADCSLKMRKPGDWYVSQDVSIKDGSILVSSYGNGSTPVEAVENHWEEIAMKASSLKPIVVIKYTDGSRDRKHYFWNGFMWCDCTPKNQAA
jgi:hypothetical protein